MPLLDDWADHESASYVRVYVYVYVYVSSSNHAVTQKKKCIEKK